MNCPECSSTIKAGSKSCHCGWSAVEQKAKKPDQFEKCDVCSNTLHYYRLKEYKPPGNRIIGRSKVGGYVCVTCYQAGESFDWRDKATNDFRERHREGFWGALSNAAYSLQGSPKADFVEYMQMLKEQARKAQGMKLPYNPQVNQETGSVTGYGSRKMPEEYT